MLTFDGTAQARAASGVAGAAHLVDIEFLSGTQYLTDWGASLVVSGNTYAGVGKLIGLVGMSESEDPTTEQMRLSITVADLSSLASAMGAATEYRDRAVKIYLQLLDEVGLPAGARVLRWQGKMNSVAVKRKAVDPEIGGVESGTVEFTCQRSTLARSRRAGSLRITHEQQMLRASLMSGPSTDYGLEYVQRLIEQPAPWLSKRFQEI